MLDASDTEQHVFPFHERCNEFEYQIIFSHNLVEVSIKENVFLMVKS